MNLLDVPADCLTCVFEYLSADDIGRCLRVCKDFYSAATASVIWRAHCMSRWSFCNISGIPAGGTSRWYRYYGLRRSRDSHMERGRPGADYTAKTLRGHKGAVCDVVYINSPDPTDIESEYCSVVTSCGVDGTIKTWAVRDGSILWESGKHGCPVRHLSVNSCHQLLVSSDDRGSTCVWNTQTGQQTLTLTPGGEESPVLSNTVISMDAAQPLILASHRDGLIRFWDVRSSTGPVHTLSAMHCTTWLSSPHTASMLLASAALQRSPVVQIWDVRCVSSSLASESPSSLVCELSSPSPVSCASWVPKQTEMLVVGCTGGELNISKVERSHNPGVNPVMLDPKATCQGHSRGVQCLGVSANTVVTGGSDHMVSVWKVHGNQLVNRQQHTDHRGLVTGVHVDGFRVVSCSADYSIRAYRWTSPSENRDGQVLESRYTLLGGSLRGSRAGAGFTKVLCDYSSCVAIAGDTLKAYSFN